MSNLRTSNFKKETATDSKQDAEISTLSTTLSGTINPNSITSKNILISADASNTNSISSFVNHSNALDGNCSIYCASGNYESANFLITANNMNQSGGLNGFIFGNGIATITSTQDMVFQANNGSSFQDHKIRFAYGVGTNPASDNYNKAISINNNGAIAFDASKTGNTITEGSYGSSGQIMASQGASLPPQWVSTISPNQINLGGVGGATLNNVAGELVINAIFDNTKTTWINTKLNCANLISRDFDNSGYAYLGNGVLYVNKDENQIVSETNASISGINEITCSKLNYTTLSPAIPTPSKSLLTFYVDGSCGADSNDGSREKPFRLIQTAINKCEQVWDGTAREVKVAFGSYSENLTISKARIQLTGSCVSRYVNTACGINGTITLQIADAVDMFNSQVFITGFQIVGSVIDASSSVHTLSIKDCYLYNQENIIQQRTRGAEILNNGVSFNPPKYNVVDCRTYLENLTINASNALGTNALVSIEAGNVDMILCTITAKSANTNCLQMVYNAVSSLFTQSSFTNDNSDSTLKPLIYVYSIFGNPTLNTFNNCGFVFGSTNAKSVSTSGNNSAIVCRNVNDYFNILRCSFYLQGVSSQSASNFVIMPIYTESKTLRYSESGNIASFGTANKICPYGVIPLAFTTLS